MKNDSVFLELGGIVRWLQQTDHTRWCYDLLGGNFPRESAIEWGRRVAGDDPKRAKQMLQALRETLAEMKDSDS